MSAALAAVLAVFFLAPAARADIQTAKQRGNIPRDIVTRAPATAIPTQGEIDPGSQIQFTLEGRGAGTKTIDFDFSTKPQHGLLTDFHLVTRNRAVVTYVHNPDSGPGQDEFEYRVMAAGLEVSAPAKVSITIHEYPPMLSVFPAELDFGVVDAGQTSRALVSVRNEGGGVAAGRLDLPAPWTVDGDAVYHLAAGEKQTFRLVFRPESGRSFSETVHVGEGARGRQNSSLHLVGAGVGGTPEKQFAGINGVAPAPLEDPHSSIPETERARTAERYPAGTAVNPAESARAAIAARGASAAAKNPPVGNAASPPATASAVAAAQGGTAPAGTAKAGGAQDDGGTFAAPVIALNEAGVKKLQVRGHGRTYLDIAWDEPKPRPAKYRVELRRLSLNENDDLVVTWLPHDKVEFHAKDGVMTVTLRGLAAGTNQSVRVIAIDAEGRFASPSLIAQTMLDPALNWWKFSLLQWLLIACAVCMGFVVRQRIIDRQILAQIEIDRAERRREAEAMSVFST